MTCTDVGPLGAIVGPSLCGRFRGIQCVANRAMPMRQVSGPPGQEIRGLVGSRSPGRAASPDACGRRYSQLP
jgi:hypothetical protein